MAAVGFGLARAFTTGGHRGSRGETPGKSAPRGLGCVYKIKYFQSLTQITPEVLRPLERLLLASERPILALALVLDSLAGGRVARP